MYACMENQNSRKISRRSQIHVSHANPPVTNFTRKPLANAANASRPTCQRPAAAVGGPLSRGPATKEPSKHLLVPIRANARRLVIFRAIVVRAVVEGPVALLDGPPTPLIHKMPIETNERPMLVAFVLQERLALVHTEFLQVSTRNTANFPIKTLLVTSACDFTQFQVFLRHTHV